MSRADTPDGLQSVSGFKTCVIPPFGQACIKDDLEFRASWKMCMLNVLISTEIKSNFVIQFSEVNGN